MSLSYWHRNRTKQIWNDVSNLTFCSSLEATLSLKSIPQSHRSIKKFTEKRIKEIQLGSLSTLSLLQFCCACNHIQRNSFDKFLIPKEFCQTLHRHEGSSSNIAKIPNSINLNHKSFCSAMLEKAFLSDRKKYLHK